MSLVSRPNIILKKVDIVLAYNGYLISCITKKNNLAVEYVGFYILQNIYENKSYVGLNSAIYWNNIKTLVVVFRMIVIIVTGVSLK